MSGDPARWKDGGDAPEVLRALVTHARAVPVLDDDVRAALAAQLPAPPGGGAEPEPGGPAEAGPPAAPGGPAVGSPAGGALAGSLGAWVLVAVVAAGIAAAVAWKAREPDPTPVVRATPPAATASVASLVASERIRTGPPVETPGPAPAETTPEAAAPSAFPSGTTPAHAAAPLRPPATKPETGTLSEESALVNRARASLASDASVTLAAIEEHARRFPHGELAPEREYLRVSALRRLGRTEEARSRARRYLATYPASSYVPSVRTILVELGGP